ncbi:fungal-specific transcription factor domain-containing protein [Penicillium atrosanguineum]|nr:fungal-specific transcription factor domain-containing protein [Penicillium atrosanguineum]
MLESRLSVNGRRDIQRGSSNDLALSVSPVDGSDGGVHSEPWISKGTVSSGSDHEVFVSNSNGLAPDSAPAPMNGLFIGDPCQPPPPPSDIIQAELPSLFFIKGDTCHGPSQTTRQRHADAFKPLYQETKQMLEYLSVEGAEHSSVNTELGQAWVLVVTFESMRTYHRTAWMSAGRAFRLVQAMRYHEIDNPIDKRGPSSPECGDFIEVEERRRVFWMAYFLDHIISMRDDWPITLNEHVICTRLPAPDGEFQTGTFELGPFLSEAMTELNIKFRSPFNECLILATICGRSLLQSQRYHISKAYGDMAMDGSDQRRWLDIADSNRSNNEITEILNYKARALEASAAIIRLASTLRELPFSKVHPLMPIPIFLCAEFLYDDMQNEAFQMHMQGLFHVLRELKNVNNPDQSYLDPLPRSCISKTADLFSHSVEENTPNSR